MFLNLSLLGCLYFEAVTSFILHHHKQIDISLSSQDISYILTAIIILLVSHVMVEACKLQDEQTLTV